MDKNRHKNFIVTDSVVDYLRFDKNGKLVAAKSLHSTPMKERMDVFEKKIALLNRARGSVEDGGNRKRKQPPGGDKKEMEAPDVSKMEAKGVRDGEDDHTLGGLQFAEGVDRSETVFEETPARNRSMDKQKLIQAFNAVECRTVPPLKWIPVSISLDWCFNPLR